MKRKAITKDISAGATRIPVGFGTDERPLWKLLQARAAAQSRSVSGQLKPYARLALIVEDNPDLPMSMIHGILEGRADMKAGQAQPYQWGIMEPARSGSG
jgi:ParD-like antitoxin of type II ParDE toxin-antitoxin system